MSHCLYLLLLAGSVHTFCSKDDVITSVQQHFQSSCVCLIMDNSSELMVIPMLTETSKHLSNRGILAQISPLKVETILHSMAWHNRPLFVSFSSNENLFSFLMKLSRRTSLSIAIWLIFIDTEAIDDLIVNIHFSFDSQFLFVKTNRDGERYYLEEIYNIAGKYRKQLFATLSPPLCQFDVSVLPLYERRSTLSKLVMKTAVFKNIPVNSAHYISNGFMRNLWNVLEKKLDFRLERYNVTSVKTWDDLIGMLHRQEVDISFAVTVMSSNRLQTVDFTVPLFSFNFQVFIRQPDVRMNWNHYLSPFSHRVWSSLVLLLLQITVVLTIMYRLARYYGYINIVHPNFVYDAFFYIFTLLFCQQGHVPPVKNGPIRLVFLVTTLTAMVILAAYSAALVSSLAIESTQLPFNSFEGLLADGSYKLGVVKHSAVLTLFKDAEEGLFKNLFEKMMDTDLNDFPANEWNGLSRICADKKFAFMAPREFVISTIQKMRCRIVGLPQAVIRVSMAIPVMRKSPYIGLLNHNLCRLRSSGLLQGLQMRILFPEQNEQMNPTVIVKLENVAILLLVLFVGVIISLMILVVERKRRS